MYHGPEQQRKMGPKEMTIGVYHLNILFLCLIAAVIAIVVAMYAHRGRRLKILQRLLQEYESQPSPRPTPLAQTAVQAPTQLQPQLQPQPQPVVAPQSQLAAPPPGPQPQQGKAKLRSVYTMVGSFAVAVINLYYFVRSPWWLNILLIIVFVTLGIWQAVNLREKEKA
jgi:hypothetical protein